MTSLTLTCLSYRFLLHSTTEFSLWSISFILLLSYQDIPLGFQMKTSKHSLRDTLCKPFSLPPPASPFLGTAPFRLCSRGTYSMAILSHTLSPTLGLHTDHFESYPSCQSPFPCFPVCSVILNPLLLSILCPLCLWLCLGCQCSDDVGGDIMSPSLHGAFLGLGLRLCQIADYLK